MGTSREWNLRVEGLKLRVEGLKDGARRLEPESERNELLVWGSKGWSQKIGTCVGFKLRVVGLKGGT